MPEITEIENPAIATIDDIARDVALIRKDQLQLLEGLQKFLQMAEMMRGNPLFSALMPPSAPPQRRNR